MARPGGALPPHQHDAAVTPRLWRVILACGAAVWVVSAVVTGLTDDDILVPTVILVGSFLVPVTTVAFALSRPREGHLSVEEVVLGFLAAGTLGVMGTALVERLVLSGDAAMFLGVGVIEELGKGLVLLAVAHDVHDRRPRDGMVLGAVVGAGFAAFETAGYALQTLLEHLDEQPIVSILETEATRALLAPFGHITWTALLGGALFAGARDGRFRLTRRLGWTFAGVIALHALWDQTYGRSIMIANGLSGAGWHATWPNAQTWYGDPSPSATVWFNVTYDTLIALNAAVGLTWLLRTWRSYRPAAPGGVAA